MSFKNFEIRQCTFVGDPPTPDYHKWNFDLVKWEKHRESDSEYCFSIGHLEWNRKEPCFEFRSCGLRYLEYREDGLEEWLLKWCELKEIEYRYEEENQY
jgi:hypothetical protein